MFYIYSFTVLQAINHNSTERFRKKLRIRVIKKWNGYLQGKRRVAALIGAWLLPVGSSHNLLWCSSDPSASADINKQKHTAGQPSSGPALRTGPSLLPDTGQHWARPWILFPSRSLLPLLIPLLCHCIPEVDVPPHPASTYFTLAFVRLLKGRCVRYKRLQTSIHVTQEHTCHKGALS